MKALQVHLKVRNGLPLFLRQIVAGTGLAPFFEVRRTLRGGLNKAKPGRAAAGCFVSGALRMRVPAAPETKKPESFDSGFA